MKKNSNIMEIAIILFLSVMLTMAACGEEKEDPQDFFFLGGDVGINYNYNYITLGPHDSLMYDFYLAWEADVYMGAS